jgi:hypothetical protein
MIAPIIRAAQFEPDESAATVMHEASHVFTIESAADV